MKEYSVIAIYCGIIVLLVFLNLVYVYATPFERTITIKEKYSFAAGSGRGLSLSNTVMDGEGRVYAIHNSLPLLHFTAAEILVQLEKGQTYKVKGYGWRVPVLGMYPNIVRINT